MTPARSDLSWWEWLLTGALLGDVFANWRRDRRERRYQRRRLAEQRAYMAALGRATSSTVDTMLGRPASSAGRALDKALDGFNEAAASALQRRW